MQQDRFPKHRSHQPALRRREFANRHPVAPLSPAYHFRGRLVAVVLAVAALLLFFAQLAEAKPPPPAQRTYFTIFLGLEGDFETTATCMKFRRAEVCDLEGDICGTWEQGEVENKQSGFSFLFEFTDEGDRITLDGKARADNRLKKSSIGGAARVTIEGTDGSQSGNFAMVGREAAPAKCRRLVDEFNTRAIADQ